MRLDELIAGLDHMHMPTQSAPTKRKSWLRTLVDPEGPWLWLVWLPFYAIPWLYVAPSLFQLAASIAGIGVFLALYLVSAKAQRTRPAFALGIAVVAIMLAPVGGNWGVIAIYAASVAGRIRSPRHAILLIALTCGSVVSTGLLLGQNIGWWAPAALLTLTVGASTLASAAVQHKNAELLKAHDEVRALSRLAERERIGRDLHDLVGRTLTLIAIKADLAERLVDADPEAAIQEIREMKTTARDGLKDVREALSGMREAGFSREIEAARLMLESAGIGFTVEGDAASIPKDRSGVLAMALREAVTNVVRHAEATQCRVVIGQNDTDVRVEVTDDGCGGSFQEAGGLSGMRERLKAAGGALELFPDGSGTRLVAMVPAG